ncbi:hypothetical protein [Sphingomonas hengshuiensis]|uniref:Uncharacterized protein n=1 Tax=Sphingomonas hengshuiensis TaxID=1609977 RepID=A0A7U4JAF9_9SPHN|nr:hypothetical protein [Sphingomonas hengshuiensis]AJP73203.1 hypothetical protein TS85_17510 [Sphingomonas hengshuiensis]
MLSACGANHNSIYRYKPIADGANSILSLDAKQRVVIRQGDKFCSEPPPDVFSVYAQSLAAGGKVSKSADPTALDVSANFSYAGSEQGATIARTQAYNLLALQVYYNCLSGLNDGGGALDGPIDRARLQRLIVSTMAIEQLTGALRPPTVVIAANGTAGAGAAGEAATRLDDAHKASVAAAGVLAGAKKTKADLEGKDPKCSALTAQVSAGTTLAGDDAKKKQACDDADKAIGDATTASAAATAHYNAMVKATDGGAGTVAGASAVAAQIVQASARDEATVREVAGRVEAIVNKNIRDQDEIQFFCIRLLSNESTQAAAEQASGSGIIDRCGEYLLRAVESETNKLFGVRGGAEKAVLDSQANEAEDALRTATDERFSRYWARVVDSQTLAPSPAKVAALIDPVAQRGMPRAIADRLKALRQAADFAAARRAFGLLPPSMQAMLVQ